MDPKQYRELKSELPEIAKIVELFPETLKLHVYQTMVGALVQGSVATITEDSGAKGSDDDSSPLEASDTSQIERRNYVTELRDYYDRYDLAKRSDMVVGVFMTYYYTKLAPQEIRVEGAGEKQFMDFCKVTGRKPPGHASTTLNNAKNRKGFLVQTGKGKYAVSDLGEHFVLHDLIKEDD